MEVPNSLNLDKDNSDWTYLMGFLPEQWEQKAWELEALQRCRNFSDAGSLLRTLMIHLADGCSLRETTVRARCGGIANVSDVALLKRLNAAGEWFRWMTMELMKTSIDTTALTLFPKNLKVRLVDATCVSKPGSVGTDWRIHYSIDLPEMRCRDLILSDQQIGETFENFKEEKDCLFIADRGYCHRKGVHYIVKNGGHVLVRINLSNFPLINAKTGKPFKVLPHLRSLSAKKIGNWPVKFEYDGQVVNGRVCAIKKTKIAADLARRKIIAAGSKKQKAPQEDTLEACGYVFVFTTLLDDFISAAKVLEVYRGRWQIELVFKRMKSLLEIGQLPKYDPVGAKAWIQGKLFCALLVQNLVNAGERFFPWGYPLNSEIA